MGDVLPLGPLARPVALHGLGQDHGGLTFLMNRLVVGGIDLRRVVTAAIETPDIVIAHVGHHLTKLRTFPEEMLARVGAAHPLVGLILPVHGFFHPLTQDPVLVLGQKRVPIAAPDHLDDVPACATKTRLEFLDDLSVSTNRTVQPLQIAIDHKNQVVEFLPTRERDRPQTFGFVGFSIAQEGPDLAARRRCDAPILEIFHEARLIDGGNRPQPHGDGGELPEIRHQARMRIGGKPMPVDFHAKMFQLIGAQATFQESSRIDARRGVSLDVEQVPTGGMIRAMKEVIEADIVKGGGRGKTGDVSTKGRVHPVGLHHHRHGVPADDGTDAMLEPRVSLARRLLRLMDGVDVRRVGAVREIGPSSAGAPDEAAHEIVGPLDPLPIQHRIQGIQPLSGLDGVLVGRKQTSRRIFGVRCTQSRDAMKSCSTYQNIRATEAKSCKAPAT